MGHVIAETTSWARAQRPSLLVVVGSGPTYVAANDVHFGRHVQFYVNSNEALVVSRSWQVSPSGFAYTADISHNTYAKVFDSYREFSQSYRPSPRTVTDIVQGNSDIFLGHDTYGWPPPPVPSYWSPQQIGTEAVLNSFPSYNPANDIFLLRPQSKVFVEPGAYFRGQQPLGAINYTYTVYTDFSWTKRQAKVFGKTDIFWHIDHTPVVNGPTYNVNTDTIFLRPSAKVFKEFDPYWTGQPITQNVLENFPSPYNPATDVRFAKPVQFITGIAIFDKPQLPSSIVINVPPTPPPPIIPGIVPNWQGRVILSPKKVGEQLFVPVDFISRLAAGETIISAAVACSVYSGIDPNAAAMPVGSPKITGTIVEQEIEAGVAGTVYELLYTVQTSLGQVLELSGYFVVEPDLP